MGDYYLMLLEQAEAAEAYYDSGDRYEPDETDMNDWFSGTSPWQEPDEDMPF